MAIWQIEYEIQYDGFWYNRVSRFITNTLDLTKVKSRFRKQKPKSANIRFTRILFVEN